MRLWITLSRRRLLHAQLAGASLSASPAIVGAPATAGQYRGKWVCTDADCDPYVYDPALGDPENIADPETPVPPDTAFAELPDTWLCPLCATPKSEFVPYYEVNAKEG